MIKHYSTIPLIKYSLYSAWIELRNSFDRNYLGTLWNAVGLFILIALLGLLFGAILKSDLQGYNRYIPFLAAGVLTWSFLSSSINESCSIFIRRAQTLRNTEQPFIAIPLTVIAKSCFIFLQNILMAVLIYVSIFQSFPVFIIPFIIGCVLLTANIFWISLLASIASIRFRDLPQFISGTLYVGFLLTPIIWTESFLGRYVYLLYFNPAYHLITLIREPLLGIMPSLKSWLAAIALLVIGTILTLLIYRRVHKKICYWL